MERRSYTAPEPARQAPLGERRAGVWRRIVLPLTAPGAGAAAFPCHPHGLGQARRMGDGLVHLHLCDGSGASTDEHLVPGRGTQPTVEICEMLAGGGFSGHVILEVTTSGARSANEREALLADLEGKRVSVGAPGSGTEVNAQTLLEANGITYDDIDEQRLNFNETADAQQKKAVLDGRQDVGPLDAGEERDAGFGDARLLPRDRGQRIPEQVGVVAADARDAAGRDPWRLLRLRGGHLAAHEALQAFADV